MFSDSSACLTDQIYLFSVFRKQNKTDETEAVNKPQAYTMDFSPT